MAVAKDNGKVIRRRDAAGTPDGADAAGTSAGTSDGADAAATYFIL